MFSNKTEVYGNEKFDAYLTFDEGMAFFHLTVKCKPSKTLLKEVKDVFLETCAYLDAAGYDRIYVYTPSKRFCELVIGKTYTDLGTIGRQDLLVWEFEDLLWE